MSADRHAERNLTKNLLTYTVSERLNGMLCYGIDGAFSH